MTRFFCFFSISSAVVMRLVKIRGVSVHPLYSIYTNKPSLKELYEKPALSPMPSSLFPSRATLLLLAGRDRVTEDDSGDCWEICVKY